VAEQLDENQEQMAADGVVGGDHGVHFDGADDYSEPDALGRRDVVRGANNCGGWS
jgi:hypothetical protein